MIRYKKNCRTCQLSKTDAKLRQRILYAAFKREEGDETLYQIADEQGISRPQMYNHVKKHISDTSPAQSAAREVTLVKKKAEFEGKVQKELELAIDGEVLDTVEARPAEIVALDDYIAQAKMLIDKGQLKITAKDFLTATKIRTDYRAKQDSTKLDYMKTIYAIASGDKKNGTKQLSSAPEASGLDSAGAEQSAAVYRAAAGTEAA